MKRLLKALYRWYLHLCKSDVETALWELQTRQWNDPAPDYFFERSNEELSEQLNEINEELERINNP
jgi:glutathione S-transferase